MGQEMRHCEIKPRPHPQQQASDPGAPIQLLLPTLFLSVFYMMAPGSHTLAGFMDVTFISLYLFTYLLRDGKREEK